MTARFKAQYLFLTILIASTLLIFTSACVKPQRSVKGPDQTDSTTGILLYSFTTMKPELSIYGLQIHNLDNHTKSQLTLMRSQETPDLDNDSLKTYYYAIRVPAGEYRFYGWTMSGAGTTYFPKGNFTIPFLVTGASVNYIGDYLAVTKRSPKFLGMSTPEGGFFVVSNRYESHYELIQNKFPDLKNWRVLDALPNFIESNSKYSGMFLKGINTP
jgi:hypothetical protein